MAGVIKNLSEQDLAYLRELYDRGLSFRVIAEKHGRISEGSVRRVVKAQGWTRIELKGEIPDAPIPPPPPPGPPPPIPPDAPPPPVRVAKAYAPMPPPSAVVRAAWDEGLVVGPMTLQLLRLQSARAATLTRLANRQAELLELAMSDPPEDDEAAVNAKARALIILMPTVKDSLGNALATVKSLYDSAHRYENDAWKVRQAKRMEDDVAGEVDGAGALAASISGGGATDETGLGEERQAITPRDFANLTTEQLMQLQQAATILDATAARPAVVLPPTGPVIEHEAEQGA